MILTSPPGPPRGAWATLNTASPQARGLVACYSPLVTSSPGGPYRVLDLVTQRAPLANYQDMTKIKLRNDPDMGAVWNTPENNISMYCAMPYVNTLPNGGNVGKPHAFTMWWRLDARPAEDKYAFVMGRWDGRAIALYYRNPVNGLGIHYYGGMIFTVVTDAMLGKWHHLAVVNRDLGVVDGAHYRLYMDGRPAAAIAPGDSYGVRIEGGGPTFGGWDAWGCWIGQIAEIRVYANIALTDADVWAMYARPWEVYQQAPAFKQLDVKVPKGTPPQGGGSGGSAGGGGKGHGRHGGKGAMTSPPGWFRIGPDV